MARALIVGCGCRGREVGAALLAAGWQVRGTTRDPARVAEIERAGIEGVLADPNLVATVHEQIDGVTLVFWLLGSASGDGEAIAAVHGSRLERLLEKLVDTPVRGLVYEASGTVAADRLEHGARVVRAASERWRIPVAVVEAGGVDWRGWREQMVAAANRLLGLS